MIMRSVKAVRGFMVAGMRVEPGEVITTSEALAAQLVSAGKAIQADPPPNAEPAAQPTIEIEPEEKE